MAERLLRRWHGMMRLTRHGIPSWYKDRLREELRERRRADTYLRRLSETSDVFFSSLRARYDGYPVRKIPKAISFHHIIVYCYMLMKFTSRWKFYQTSALLCREPRHLRICEVVNPSKDAKLKEVATRHGIDPDRFAAAGRRLRPVWPLLP